MDAPKIGSGQNNPKIDSLATNGLSGIEDSLAYRVEEIEKHLHNNEKWFGAAAVPSGETHIVDRMGPGIAAIALLSGNDAFGSWTQVLGSADTPVKTGMVSFDAHRYMVTTTDSTSPFLIQVVSGESAGIAAKLASEDYSEYPYIAPTNSNDAGINEAMSIRTAAGTKLWARCICIGQNAKTINVYYGIHEYEG